MNINQVKFSVTAHASWSPSEEKLTDDKTRAPEGIEIHQFFSDKESILERICNDQRWQWQHYT